MAIADITFHDYAAPPRYAFSDIMGVAPEQVGNSVQLDFTSGTDEIALDANNHRLLRLVADADCRVAVLDSGTATTANSMAVRADIETWIFLPAGKLLSVMADA